MFTLYLREIYIMDSLIGKLLPEWINAPEGIFLCFNVNNGAS